MNTGKFGPELASQPSGVVVPAQEQKVNSESAEFVVQEAALERSELQPQARLYVELRQYINQDKTEKAELNHQAESMCDMMGQQEALAEIAGDKLDNRVDEAKKIEQQEEARRQTLNARIETNLFGRRQIIADWQSHISELRNGFSEVLSVNHGRAGELCNSLHQTLVELGAVKAEAVEIESQRDLLGPKVPRGKKEVQAAEARFNQLSPIMDSLVKSRTAELVARGDGIKQSGDQFAINNEMQMFEQYGGLYETRAEEEVRNELDRNEIELEGYDRSADYLRQYDEARSQHHAAEKQLAERSGQLKMLESRGASLRETSDELIDQKNELIELTFDDIVNDHEEFKQLHEAIKAKEVELKQRDKQNQTEYKQLLAEVEKLDAPLIEPTDEAIHLGMVERLATKGIKRDRLPAELGGLVHKVTELFEPTAETTGDGIHHELIEFGMQDAPTGVEATRQATEAIMFKQRFERGELPDDVINAFLRSVLTTRVEFDPGEGDHLQLIAKVLTTAKERQTRYRTANEDKPNRQETARSRVAPDSEQTAKGWLKSSPETVSLGAIRTAGDIAGSEEA